MIKKLHFDKLREKYVLPIHQIELQSFSDPWTEEALSAECYNPLAHYLVGMFDEEVVCYGGFWKILEEGHITNIAVAKEYRGKGIGERTLNELMTLAKGMDIERLTLEVRRSNTPAISLYEKWGFRSVGVRPGYYQDGEDAEIYWCELKEQHFEHND